MTLGHRESFLRHCGMLALKALIGLKSAIIDVGYARVPSITFYSTFYNLMGFEWVFMQVMFFHVTHFLMKSMDFGPLVGPVLSDSRS